MQLISCTIDHDNYALIAKIAKIIAKAASRKSINYVATALNCKKFTVPCNSQYTNNTEYAYSCTELVVHTYTAKPETLTSGNFDEFGKFASNCQTLTFQSKATKQNKRLQIICYL